MQNQDVKAMSNAELQERNHYLLIDASSSMNEPSNRQGFKTRWDEAKEYAVGMAAKIGALDEDGFDLIIFNGKVTDVAIGLTDANQVSKLFEQQPFGSTATHSALDQAAKMWKASNKKAMIHLITDGEPNDGKLMRQSIVNMVKTMTDDSDLAINIMQAGNDEKCTKFLKQLDDELVSVDKVPFDAVNTLRLDEADGLSFEQICWLSLND